MVPEGDPTAIQGTLSIREGVLAFEPSSGSRKLSVPTRDIRKARRSRISPVLSVSFSSGRGAAKVHFFFSKPPPLPGAGPSVPSGVFRSSRGLERAAAALSLRATNSLKKRTIDEWVRELKRG
jgi:hypothetical protein